jgi:hypothetical protein
MAKNWELSDAGFSQGKSASKQDSSNVIKEERTRRVKEQERLVSNETATEDRMRTRKCFSIWRISSIKAADVESLVN